MSNLIFKKDFVDNLSHNPYFIRMTLDEYRIEKKLSYRKMAQLLDVGHATIVRRWCLPPSHPQRVLPRPEYMERLLHYTNGAVQPNDFYTRG